MDTNTDVVTASSAVLVGTKILRELSAGQKNLEHSRLLIGEGPAMLSQGVLIAEALDRLTEAVNASSDKISKAILALKA